MFEKRQTALTSNQRPRILASTQSPFSNDPGNRIFSVRASGNPGNSRSDALTIKNYPYNNEARIGSDENGSDFYKIKQDKDKKIKFKIYVENDEGVLGPSLTFSLQNKNGKTLDSDKVSGRDDDEIVRKLGKGTFYIKVSTEGESVPYDIKVTKP